VSGWTGGGRRSAGGRPAQGTAQGTALHIDWSRCDGRGLCAELLDGVVGRDPWGYPLVRGGNDVPVPPARERDAVQAVRACPLAALRLTGGAGRRA